MSNPVRNKSVLSAAIVAAFGGVVSTGDVQAASVANGDILYFVNGVRPEPSMRA